MGIFNKREKRAVGDAIISAPDYFGTGLTFGSLLRNSNAMNISAVYRAVDIISESVAILPLSVCLKDDNSTVANHQLYSVFDNKNNIMTYHTFMKMLIQSVLLRGNGFAYIERNADGSVKSLRFLEAGDVTINYNKVKGTLSYSIPSVTAKLIEPINVIHLVKNTYDGVNGISVISYANRAVSNSNATDLSALNFYQNGCNLAGVLKVQGQLTPQQKNDIRNSWSTAYSGGGSGLAVLQGNMEYSPIQVSSKDAQLLEARQYNVQDIARFFGVSPTLLGDLSHTSYKSLEAEQNAFLVHTLQGYITMVEEEFTKKLLKPSEGNLCIELDESELIRTDQAAKANYLNTLVQNGILTRNEARKTLGYAPVDGGDDLLIAYTNTAENKITNSDTNE